MTNSTNAQSMEKIAQSKTSPKSNKQGKVAETKVFSITDIPKAMDKLGWTVSAKLMRQWFRLDKNKMSRDEKEGRVRPSAYKGLRDTTTVTMNWVLGFERAKRKYDAIFFLEGFGVRLYERVSAQEVLINKLKTAGKFTDKVEKFGNLGADVVKIDEKYAFQYQLVGTSLSEKVLDPLDDLYGSLAAFAFKIAASGEVIPRYKDLKINMPKAKDKPLKPDYYEVSVQKIGVYVRDTYDFIDEQYLGHWNENGVEIDIRLRQSGYIGKQPNQKFAVANRHFREYRDKFKKGGDFFVFSDVLVTELAPPFTFDAHVSP